MSHQDPIRQELAPIFTLLAAVREDEELNALWLKDCQQEALALIQLTAQLAQWDNIEQLWDRLKQRCTQEQRPINEAETHILATAITIYNLTLGRRQASLAYVEAGTAYHYEQHQRGNTVGEQVVDTWLPALLNAAGQTRRKALLHTQ